MAAVTLSTLRARVRERADLVGSAFITDGADSLDNWINRGCEIVHQKLVDAYAEEYLEKTATFTTTSGTETYALPSDFLSLLGVELQLAARWVGLKKYQRVEQNAYREASPAALSVPRYRLAGSNLRLLPAPTGGISGRIIYAPPLQTTPSGGSAASARLVAATDSVNFPNGWEAYAETYAAIQALVKEESDTRALERELSRMDSELEAIKLARDAATPHQVADLDLDDINPYIYPA